MKYLCLLYVLFLAFDKGQKHDADVERLVYVRTDTGTVPFKSYVVVFKLKSGCKIIHTDRVRPGLYIKTIATGEFSHSQITFTIAKKSELHYSHTPYVLGDFIQKDSSIAVNDYVADYWGTVYDDSLTLKSANIYKGKPADDHGMYYLVK